MKNLHVHIKESGEEIGQESRFFSAEAGVKNEKCLPACVRGAKLAWTLAIFSLLLPPTRQHLHMRGKRLDGHIIIIYVRFSYINIKNKLTSQCLCKYMCVCAAYRFLLDEKLTLSSYSSNEIFFFFSGEVKTQFFTTKKNFRVDFDLQIEIGLP